MKAAGKDGKTYEAKDGAKSVREGKKQEEEKEKVRLLAVPRKSLMPCKAQKTLQVEKDWR